jgi:hypothetical protein
MRGGGSVPMGSRLRNTYDLKVWQGLCCLECARRRVLKTGSREFGDTAIECTFSISPSPERPDFDYHDQTFVFSVAAAAPEASTWAMMLLGFAGIGFMAFRKRKNGLALAA